MPEPLWTPSSTQIAQSQLTHFMQAVSHNQGHVLEHYTQLHAWSVRDTAQFWDFYVRYTDLFSLDGVSHVLSPEPMPHNTWFEGARLNYAEILLYPPNTPADAIAITALDEQGHEQQLSFAQLRKAVGRCAAALDQANLRAGDRVAAYISNVPEAIILFLACVSRGIIYSSCSPDFGFETAFARFGQIQPKLLFASDSYSYNGKQLSTLSAITQLSDALEGLQGTITIPQLGQASLPSPFTPWHAFLASDDTELSFAQLPFDHPLYILYSSGTTGLPKAIVHRAGGALLKHHSEQRLHNDIRAGDKVFYFTTCGWMMWNWLVSALAQGATLVLFEGSPSHPNLEVLWHIAGRLGVTYFGTSARFIHSCDSMGITPKEIADLSALRTVASTGSPLSPQGFAWVYEAVKSNVHLASISGGTDIVGCFMGGVPTLPVYSGQIQGPTLGTDLVAIDEDGQAVTGTAAELVCKQALPSMPLCFWGDDGSRYRGAYFEHFEGLWRHGDLIEITDQGGIVVHGRSDATLNPGGVRIGSAEIYRPLESIPDILEMAAVGKKVEGDEEIWLFVVLREGTTLTEPLTQTIRQQIRQNASPRHMPKRVLAVSQLPRTRSGKTTEIALARLINGRDIPNRSAMANPEALTEIAQLLTAQRAKPALKESLMRKNLAKAKMAAGQAVINGWLHIPSTLTAEGMSQQGFDSLTTDMQHGLIHIESALPVWQAISISDVTPMTRVPWNEPGVIMRALDGGAMGVICPMVNTREECEAFVGACRYPPQGYRSFGPTRASLYAGKDYGQHANDEILTLAMVETAQALDNLDDIMSVPGLDGVYVGPSDLNISLAGSPGMDFEDGPVPEALARIVAAAKEHGIVAGLHTGSPSYAKKMIEQGFLLVSLSSDLGMLLSSAKRDVQATRGNISDDKASAY